jgi:hypothetical protein
MSHFVCQVHKHRCKSIVFIDQGEGGTPELEPLVVFPIDGKAAVLVAGYAG